MYLKKVDGPRAVQLPDGGFLTRADLPAPDTRRWVASRKQKVVMAVRHGLISEEQACARYSLSAEELEEWTRAADSHGIDALKATRLQKYRQP